MTQKENWLPPPMLLNFPNDFAPPRSFHCSLSGDLCGVRRKTTKARRHENSSTRPERNICWHQLLIEIWPQRALIAKNYIAILHQTVHLLSDFFAWWEISELIIYQPWAALFPWRAMCSLVTAMHKVIPHFARCPAIENWEVIIP